MTVFEAAHQADYIQAAEKLGLHIKRSGSKAFTCCLFHAEKTPSMCLYPHDGGFYCFGCHEYGDAIRLYERALDLPPIDAAKRICADFGFPYDQRKRQKKQLPLPNRLPSMTAQTLAKKLGDWREEQVQRMLEAQQEAEARMEAVETRCLASGQEMDVALDAPDWQKAFKQKCRAQERIAMLDGMALPELLMQMKEEMNGTTRA